MRNREKQRLIKKIVRGGMLNYEDEMGVKDHTAFLAIKNMVEKGKRNGGRNHEFNYKQTNLYG